MKREKNKNVSDFQSSGIGCGKCNFKKIINLLNNHHKKTCDNCYQTNYRCKTTPNTINTRATDKHHETSNTKPIFEERKPF